MAPRPRRGAGYARAYETQRTAYRDLRAKLEPRRTGPRIRVGGLSRQRSGAVEDFPVTRGSTTLKVELKAAEAWSELADGSRQYSWGGHGVNAAPLTISRQLLRSGAHVLLLTFPEPDLAPVAIGPANQQALWYFVIDVRSLPRSKWTHLQVKHLHRTKADVQRLFGVEPTQDLKTAFAALFDG